MPKPRPCREQGCPYPCYETKRSCGWHYMMRQPIELQVHAALWRLSKTPEGQRRARVPKEEWPAGERWCGGCQSMVPLWATQGSRCRACSSRAAHQGHIKRTYDLDPDEYDALLLWQGGRCYVCRKTSKKRLAVDHDHGGTGAVRGLLCASDEWGCNRAVLGVVRDLDTARRLVAYYELSPLERMRRGEPPPA